MATYKFSFMEAGIYRQESEEDYIIKVRKYETTSEASKKKHALSLLTKVIKKLAKGEISFELELAIDDASALIGVDDYKTAIGILNNVKLKNLAKKLSEILL